MFPQPKINGTLSGMAEAINGVPLGSVVGLILFAICVNDLPHNSSTDSLLYAHDVSLIALFNRHDKPLSKSP